MSGISHVIKRSGTTVPFNRDRITNAIYRAAVAVGGRDKARSEELTDQVIEILNREYGGDRYPHIEEIQDVVEKVLIENGHARVAKAYILYRQDRNQARLDHSRRASVPRGNIPWAKIWHVLDWAVGHDLHTVEALNKRIEAGDFPQIVHESEAAYEDDLGSAARVIEERLEHLRVVIISGPSSSGKTTTTIRLEKRLQEKGYRFKALNVDHYFFDLELHPKDEFGDYDFETPQALDLELINQHLGTLIAGDEVKIPFYDFKIGRRSLEHTPMSLAQDEILLIDSLHGLYPQMTGSIPDTIKFKLYLEPLLQMKGPDGEYVRWTDLRMIRRMLRDAVYRAYDPQSTLEHWHYVRSSELRHIIPYQGTAEFIINTGMPYELPLYRPRLLANFTEWSELYEDDELRQDAYTRALRVLKVLHAVAPMEDDSAVPPNSVLREFIGGSSLEY
jgi:uridine kinase